LSREEKTISNELIYEGRVIKLYREQVESANGRKSYRDIVRHKGACAIIAEAGGRIVLIKQYRKALDKTIYELPAGCIEEGEDIYECAKRELNEETGYESDNLVLLSSIFSTPGFSDEIIHIFYAKNASKSKVKKDCDEDEYIDAMLIEESQLCDMITSGEIADAKTICAYFLYKNYNHK